MPPRRATGEDENPPDIATLLAQQLQNLLPEIVNQVTASVNANANNGNGNGANGGNGGNGNNGCTYKSFMSCNPKEYDGKGGAVVLTRWIERMETIDLSMNTLDDGIAIILKPTPKASFINVESATRKSASNLGLQQDHHSYMNGFDEPLPSSHSLLG
ncbi:hypothetical protein Tco_0506086 [Tanacetum coccineum]